MPETYIIASIVVALVTVALTAAYLSGALDPVIKEMGVMFFKAKAEAEAKKMQAQGMKEGEDFLKGLYPAKSILLGSFQLQSCNGRHYLERRVESVYSANTSRR
jgi:hypothetical protein